MIASAELALPREPGSVQRARAYLREQLQGVAPDLADDAEVVVSELVTNAVLHGEAPLVVRVQCVPVLRVEVEDAGRSMPIVVGENADAMTGRGLAMVATLSARWGVERRPTGGKVVWAELEAGAAAADRPAAPSFDIDEFLASWDDDEAEPTFTVRLGAVATDLLLEAKAHIDNVVRELVLVGEASAADQRELPPELDELIRSVRVDFVTARGEIKRQAAAAAARGDALTDLELHLPATAADAGERYLAALDQADRYARAAHLLTLAPPPTHRVFRRWYVGSLVDQLRALSSGRPAPTPRPFQVVLAEEFTALAQAAADSRRLATLQEVARQLAEVDDATAMARVVVDRAAEVLGVEAARVRLLGPDQVLRSVAVGGHATPPPAGYPDYAVDDDLPGSDAVRTRQPVFVPDLAALAASDPRLRGPYRPGRGAYAVPLVVGDQPLGLLTVTVVTGEMTSDGELALVVSLADLLASGLKRVELAASDAAARESLRILADATEVLTSAGEPDEVLGRMVDLAVPSLGDWCTVYLVDGEVLRRTAISVGGQPELSERLRHVPLPLDPVFPQARAFLDGEVVVGPQAPRTVIDALDLGVDLQLFGDLDASVAMCAPIELRGERIGVLAVNLLRGRVVPANAVETLTGLAARAALAYDSARRAQAQRAQLDGLVAALLPGAPPTIPGVEVAVRYLASSGEVAGDWWEVEPLADGRLVLGIGDAAGHGLPAVSRMAQLRQGARALAAVTADPLELLDDLDRSFDGFATALYGRLDPADGSLEWASAGHVPGLLARADGTVEVLDAISRPALGAPGEWRRPPVTTVLGDGDTLLLSTDGVVERRGEVLTQGIARLAATLRACTGAGLTVDELADRLVEEHCVKPSDDCCLLVVRRTSPPGGADPA